MSGGVAYLPAGGVFGEGGVAGVVGEGDAGEAGGVVTGAEAGWPAGVADCEGTGVLAGASLGTAAVERAAKRSSIVRRNSGSLGVTRD